jgi:RNA recognition motif-containing protein
MSSTKKPKPQSVSLNDFVGKAEEDWAELPSQPVIVQESMPESLRSGASGSTSLEGRAPDLSKIQPGGPYVAYVGNFPFETTEEHLLQFFDGLPMLGVKIALDYATKSSRGYAYVEFKTEQALRDAVSVTGTEFMGRRLRIDVADVKERTSKFGSSGSFQHAPRPELSMKREQFAVGDTPRDWRSAAAAAVPTTASARREAGITPRENKPFATSRFTNSDFVFKRRED